ncbi:MAG: universal stress protein [Cyanobacteria bacterium P01_D01_bin.14]
MRKILVGLDRSELSTQVLQQAIAIAKRWGAQIRLIHSMVDSEPDAPQQAFYMGEHYYPMIDRALIDAYQRDWNEFVSHTRSWLDQQASTAIDAGVEATYELTYGNPGGKLCDAAERWDADAIIVGSRGRSAWSEWLLGSVSNYVMRRSPCSVMIVRPSDAIKLELRKSGASTTADVVPPAPTQRILVPVDRSDTSEQAIAEAVSLAKAYGAELKLVHVLVEGDPGSPKMPLFDNSQYIVEYTRTITDRYHQEWNKFVNDWWVWLRSQAATLEAEGVTVSYDVMQGLAGQQICQLAEQWSADLIVIGCRGLSGLREMLVGSTSHYVSHRASCSVWVTHPKSPEAAATPLEADAHRSSAVMT